MSQCREETKLEKMIREYCEDRTPILPPGVPYQLLGLSEAELKAVDEAGSFAEAGARLGEIFGEMAGRVMESAGRCFQEDPQAPTPFPLSLIKIEFDR